MAGLFAARSIAVFGASDRSLLHRTTLENLLASDRGPVLGVNPRRAEVLGVPCVPRAADLPIVPDAALMLVPDAALEGAVDDALAHGIRTLVVCGLDDGPRQLPVVDRIARAVRSAGALMVGPNCVGVAAPGGLSPWIGSIPATVTPGPIAVLSQSGAVGEAIVGLGPRLGLRMVATLGYEATVDVADFCAFLADDDATRAVGLFLETVRRPDALAAAASRLARARKPVVALKVGRSAAAAASARAHTGADAGTPEAFAALARASGMVLVEDYAELVEALALLDRVGPLRGKRVGAVTYSGGEAALLADVAERVGVPFAPVDPGLAARLRDAGPAGLSGANPLDAWCSEDILPTFRRALDAMAASGDFDLLVGQADLTPHIGEMERRNATLMAQALAEAGAAHGIPGALLSMQASEPPPEVDAIARRDGLALLREPRAALRAIGALADWRPAEVPSAVPVA
ncbi:MAG TPA: CoA-binding protein [Baekduia sp.]|uniref:CoA-binding protein n=1 Tax=Baekduia sp. TaxID=2600305 RepID=UPI002D7673CD|nr:CoA-binding protein [Baekduia sp.]HET6509707.1 CoA-binding protein [Baekduia sp.]